MKRFILNIFAILTLTISAYSQTRVVSGVITDPESGEPLPGVNVLIKGTNQDVVTDINGYYELEAPVGSVLVFSSVGFTSREMVVQPLDDDEEKTAAKVYRHTIPGGEDKTLSPYFFVKSDDPSLDRMPLKSTSAVVNVAGVIADVMVRQVYINEGENPLEAVYIFPASTQAAVYDMTMQVGNRLLQAKIREKQQARQEYEQAKSEGKTATLLEQKRPNVFQMNVANILPGDTIIVKLRYTELLTPTEGIYEFVYPTVVGPRYSETPDDDEHAEEDWVENPYLTEGEAPDYTFDFHFVLNAGIPVQRIYSPSHKMNVDYKGESGCLVRLDESEIYGGNRDVAIRYSLRGKKVESGMLLYEHGDENFFLVMMEPPERPEPDMVPRREYVFIVDVSGSMTGFPLNVAKKLLTGLLERLNPHDTFNLLFFSGGTYWLSDRSLPVTPENLNLALEAIDRQRGGGGTRLLNALQQALNMPHESNASRTFVVVTDGFVNVEKEAFNLVRNHRNKANLFAFGIGSSVNRYIIEGLAHAGMGEPFIILNENEAARSSKKFIDMIEKPVLTNIELDINDFNLSDIEPVSAPDVFTERPVILFGKYIGEPKGELIVRGISGNNPYEKRIDVSLASRENNQALRYLWARNKIKYLDDYAQFYEGETNHYYNRLTEPSEFHAKQITALGLKYNLLTRYTSFVAVDSLIRNTGETPATVKQPTPLPQGVTNQAVAVHGLVNAPSFSLSPDIQQLNEVVTIGYGQVMKSSVTASVVSVETGEVSDRTLISASEAMQGRVSGVEVYRNSGEPGAEAAVRIRGGSSLINGAPLYVVDGVAMGFASGSGGAEGMEQTDPLAHLNPDDIKSLQVVKSGESMALYGSRAANGVILIETKKGAHGRLRLNYSTDFSVEQPNKLPELQRSYAQGRPENGAYTWRGADQGERFSWGPAIENLYFDGSDYPFDQHGRLTEVGGENPARVYDAYDFLKTGYTYNHYLSVSQGGENHKLFLSGGHVASKGNVPGSGLSRQTLKANVEKEFFSNLKLSLDGAYGHIRADRFIKGGNPSGIMFGLLTTPPTFDNGNGQSGKKAAGDPQTYLLSDQTQRSYNHGATGNPYRSVNHNPAWEKSDYLIGGFRAEYALTNWLKSKAGVNYNRQEENQKWGLDKFSAGDPAGRFVQRNAVYNKIAYRGELSADLNSWSDFELSGAAIYKYTETELAMNRLDGRIMTDPGVFQLHNVLQSSNRDYNLRRFGHTLAYNLRAEALNYLLFSFANSHNWSSAIDQPMMSTSLGSGLKIAEMPFMPNAYWLNELKLRLNYSRNETDAPLTLASTFYDAAVFDFNNFHYSMEDKQAVYNSRLRPEKTVQWDLGLDVGLLSNRIEISASVYSKKTTDMFLPELMTTRLVSLQNGGEMTTRGIDVEVFTMTNGHEFQWRGGLAFSAYRNKVTALPDGKGRIPLAGFESVSANAIEGYPLGVIYGSRYLRNEAGELVISDDGFPMVDPLPGVIGDPNPDWMLGLNNSFAWRNFTLQGLINLRIGGEIWNGTRNVLNYYGTGKESGALRNTERLFEGIVENGDPNDQSVLLADPADGLYGSYWTRYGETGVAEEAIEDASSIRLSDVSLTYTFPQHRIGRFKINRLSLSLFAKNLLLYSKYSGVDPDSDLTGSTVGRGLDYFNYPLMKSYGISLCLGL